MTAGRAVSAHALNLLYVAISTKYASLAKDESQQSLWLPTLNIFYQRSTSAIILHQMLHGLGHGFSELLNVLCRCRRSVADSSLILYGTRVWALL